MSEQILIVDDDEQILQLLEKRLQSHGYTVVKAGNGEEAIEKIHSSKPDLIILDVVMPKMDGYSLVRNIRKDENYSKIPVIVLSGKDKMKDLFEMEGIHDYLLKPYRPEELISKVSAALGIKQAKES